MVRIVVSLLVITLSGTLSAAVLEKTGAPQITLDGGKRGVVAFPHQRHQNTLKDCQICHTLFPQELGGIERLKQEGKLVKKQVMTKHCINCHKATKRSGNKSGPIKCSECHAKQEK
ncbi:MAG: cytochrome c3 family protein [Desulfobacteraceae bacterium]|jgi:ribosomal protein L44E